MTQPTAVEVLDIALINRARLDPSGEAARDGIDLNEGLSPGTITTASKQPLAWNSNIETAARQHSQDMITNDYFAHNSQNGQTPFDRMTAAGYNWSTAGENIATEGPNSNTTAAVADEHNLLFVDSGVQGRGHRTNMLNGSFQEIGAGVATGNSVEGNPTVMLTEDYGARSGGLQFITGIAYNDTDNNAFYSVGEGRANITAAITAGNQVTGTAGMYSGSIGTGAQTVTFSGGDLGQSVSVSVTVTSGRNVMVDLIGQSTVDTSTSLTEISGITKIIGLGNLALTLTGGAGGDTIIGGLGGDILNGGAGADVLTGSTGSDKFVFDTTSLSDAQAGTPLIDHVTDYDKSGGTFSTAEGDQLDVSVLTSSAFSGGQVATALARVVSDPGNAHALLQVDTDGTANGIHWTTIADLDGIHNGDTVNVIVSGSQPSGTALPVLSDDGHFGDFDGDGKADILWRNDNGTVATWQMNGATPTGHFLPGVSSDWHIIGTADFNNDHKTDILWQNDSGALLDWQMASSSALGTTIGLGTAPANSYLAGLGDVDGDGKADLFWRDASTGAVTINTIAGATNTITGVGTDWSVVGIGDYNGDGVADVMFRNASQGINAAWLMNGTSVGSTVFYPGVPNDWHVVGTGDFNGDGKADLLWHEDNGSNAVWFMNGAGAVQSSAFFGGVSSDWHVVGTGDFNGDHIDDVVWRDDNGAMAIWQMNGASTPTVAFPSGVPADWATSAHHYDFV